MAAAIVDLPAPGGPVMPRMGGFKRLLHRGGLRVRRERMPSRGPGVRR
jgi:hypothetical protein